MPGLKASGLRTGRTGSRRDKAIDTGAPGGRSKCMPVQQFARNRAGSAKATIPGACSKPQSPSACGTQGEVPASVAVPGAFGVLRLPGSCDP